jgi:hypothetical protein
MFPLDVKKIIFVDTDQVKTTTTQKLASPPPTQ